MSKQGGRNETDRKQLAGLKLLCGVAVAVCFPVTTIVVAGVVIAGGAGLLKTISLANSNG